MRYAKHILIGILLTAFATIALAQSEYRIRPGDSLAIEVLEDASLNRQVVVLPDGRFSFPFAGTLPAAGRTVEQIETTIASAIAPNFTARPNVFVSVQPKAEDVMPQAELDEDPTIDIYLMGEFNTPGLRTVRPETTFLQAIAQGGGLTRFAADKRIQLRSTDPRSGRPLLFIMDYRTLSRGVSQFNDRRLQDGDVILVPERRLFE